MTDEPTNSIKHLREMTRPRVRSALEASIDRLRDRNVATEPDNYRPEVTLRLFELLGAVLDDDMTHRAEFDDRDAWATQFETAVVFETVRELTGFPLTTLQAAWDQMDAADDANDDAIAFNDAAFLDDNGIE